MHAWTDHGRWGRVVQHESWNGCAVSVLRCGRRSESRGGLIEMRRIESTFATGASSGSECLSDAMSKAWKFPLHTERYRTSRYKVKVIRSGDHQHG
jgi:hypothetical protein